MEQWMVENILTVAKNRGLWWNPGIFQFMESMEQNFYVLKVIIQFKKKLCSVQEDFIFILHMQTLYAYIF